MAKKRAKWLLFAMRLIAILVVLSVDQCGAIDSSHFLIRSIQVRLNDSGSDLKGIIVYGKDSSSVLPSTGTIIQTLSLANTMKTDQYLKEVVPEHLNAYCSAMANKLANNQRALQVDEVNRRRFSNENCYFLVERLDLSTNRLVHFPSGLLKDWFYSLKHLNLSNNAIESLNSSVDFWPIYGRDSLFAIDFSFNRIKTIELDTFKYLNSLKYLNLAHNQIAKIDLFAFTTDTQFLVELDLSNNLINDQSIEFLLFASLTNLKVLNLKNNRLTTLSHHLLFNLYNLEHLSLANNHLKSFDIFRLNRNNEMLRYIDLSQNWNLRLEIASKYHRKIRTHEKKIESGLIVDDGDEKSEEHSDSSTREPTNNVEYLNLAGINMSHLDPTLTHFLDSLLERYKVLRSLNMSSCLLKNVTSRKWPQTIETIDLSNNLIKDDGFDCHQFASISSVNSNNLRSLSLNGNRLRNFKSLISSCSFLLNAKHKKQRPFAIDLRDNLFESLDSLSTLEFHSSNESIEASQCQEQSGFKSLLLAGNPIVCDCDQHNWWSSVGVGASSVSLTTFSFNKEFCLSVTDYEKLSCTSVSILEQVKTYRLYKAQKAIEEEDESFEPIARKDQPVEQSEELEYQQTRELLFNLTSSSAYPSIFFPRLGTSGVFKFESIRQHLIAPSLICPYKYSCSAKTCECCGFRACDCSFHCPSVCYCARDYAHTFDLVNCTKVNLNFIPNYLPTSTTELLLDGNNLKRIQPYQFFGRFRLNRLDLSRNLLAFIEENCFHGLTNLKVLKLSHNNLQILLGYEFKDLLQLEHLYLDSNQIQFISNSTFSSLINLKYLYLLNNNLRHYLEHNIYFQFNTHLVNLSIEYAKNLEASRYELDTKSDKQIEMIVESSKNRLNRTTELWNPQANTLLSLDGNHELIGKKKNKTGVRVLSNHNFSRKTNRKFEMRSSLVNGQPAKQLFVKANHSQAKSEESWEYDNENEVHSKSHKSFMDKSPITYLAFFKNLTKPKKTADMLGTEYYECILSRFKETILYPLESSNETISQEIVINLNGTEVPITINETIRLEALIQAPDFRVLIAKNFKKYRMICCKLLSKSLNRSVSQNKMSSSGSQELSFETTESDSQEVTSQGEFKYGNTDLVPVKVLGNSEESSGVKTDDYTDQYYGNVEDFASNNRFSVDDKAALNGEMIANQKLLVKETRNHSSFIVVNYTTIIWYTFLLVVGALLFSIILAMFITRIQSHQKVIKKTKLDESGPSKPSRMNRRPLPYQANRVVNFFNFFRKHFFPNDVASDSQQNPIDSQNTSNDTISSSHNSTGSHEIVFDHKDIEPSVTMLGGVNVNLYEYKKSSPTELPGYSKAAREKVVPKPRGQHLMRNSVSNNTINMNNYSSLSKLIKMKELPETGDGQHSDFGNCEESSGSSCNLKSDEKEGFDSTDGRVSSQASGTARSIGEKKKSKYDLFIVYNKLDSDYVCDVIAPILKGKPYFFSVALQHHLDEKHERAVRVVVPPTHPHVPAAAIKATTTFTADAITTKTVRGNLARSSCSANQRHRQKMSMINLNNNSYFYESVYSHEPPGSMTSSTTNSHVSSTSPSSYIPPILTSSSNSLHRKFKPPIYSNHKVGSKKLSSSSSSYSIARIEHLVDYVKTSSLVIFVLSKNLFTETEYKLALQTPKSKKIAILADDICESIAEKILKPKKIIKGSFDGSDSEMMMMMSSPLNFESSSSSAHSQHTNEYIELNEEFLETAILNNSSTDDSTTIDSGTATAVTISSIDGPENSPYLPGLDSLIHQSILNTHHNRHRRSSKHAQIDDIDRPKKASNNIKQPTNNQNKLDI